VSGAKTTATVTTGDVPERARPAAYFFSRFELPGAPAEADGYEATLGAPPANQVCKVYAGQTGKGADLRTKGALRVGCEWSYDMLSRSSDGAISGPASAVVVGGADVPIGATEALGEGRFVVFRSAEKGLAGNTNGQPQIFWRDRASGITRLVSHDPSGAEGDGASEAPAISADGLTVAFGSSATNLVPGDANNRADIFVWSAKDDVVTRVSVGPNGEPSDGTSAEPTLSGDGRVIAFMTNSTTVVPVPNDGSTSQKVVRIDRVSGERTLVTRHRNTDLPSEGSSPKLSEDGNRMVFQSFRDVIGDINTYQWDIFVYDHAAKSFWPVSLAPGGTPHDGKGTCTSCGTYPAISGDGKWVTFPDGSANLAPGFTDGTLHGWLVEVDACSPTLGRCNVVPIDVSAEGAPADAASPNRAIPLSYDGRYASFTSAASNLGAPKGKYPVRNVFVFDRDAKAPAARIVVATQLIESTAPAEEATSLSRRGAYVAFRGGGALDARFERSGAFAAFTGLGDAFAWHRGPLE